MEFPSIISYLLGALALLSIGLNLWQFAAASRFPLHRRSRITVHLPAVTLLKPLKGCDEYTEKCLRTWFEQSYPAEIQILFGVADFRDPVCEIVQKLITEFPGKGELVHCYPMLGSNAKVSSLIHLSRRATHDFWVVSDADVVVPVDFLAQVLNQLVANNAGVVNAFYQMAEPRNLAMKWEAVAVNADFWSQVLQGVSLKKMDFALGAVMATTRTALKGIGGFEALVEFLADDYQLGNKVAGIGRTVELSPIVVECLSGDTPWLSVWAHQLRWSRTVRVCQPVPYFFSILSNATLWPLVLVAAFPCKISGFIAAIALALRIFTAGKNYSRLIGGRHEGLPATSPSSSQKGPDGNSLPSPCSTTSMEGWRVAWLAPVKDLLQFFIWLLSFVGNKIEWRGQKFRVLRGGKLVRLEP